MSYEDVWSILTGPFREEVWGTRESYGYWNSFGFIAGERYQVELNSYAATAGEVNLHCGSDFFLEAVANVNWVISRGEMSMVFLTLWQ